MMCPIFFCKKVARGIDKNGYLWYNRTNVLDAVKSNDARLKLE